MLSMGYVSPGTLRGTRLPARHEEIFTMKRSTKISLSASALAALVSVGVLAATAGAFHNDALPVAQAKVSMTEAINAAERHVGGKAARAEYERNTKRGQWIYDVEVVAGAKVFDVEVDATSGAVLSSSEDRADNDDGHDKKD